MEQKKAMSWALSLLLLLANAQTALGEHRNSLPSDSLEELQAAIERQEGLSLSLEDLEVLTTLDPLPFESRFGTRTMGQDPSQDSLGACLVRCDDAHSICLDSLWFFPELRCRTRRDRCHMDCAIEDIDRSFP